MTKYAETLKNYRFLNETAEKNAAVFFGADKMCEIPIAELARDNGIDTAVYNRSLKGLTGTDAEAVIDDCVCNLYPDRVFINIGENDIINTGFNRDEFAEKIEWLMYTIHSKCCCKLYVLSVATDKHNTVNSILKSIAEKHGCEYIDICGCISSPIKFFSKIRFFLRNHPITFCEAIRM